MRRYPPWNKHSPFHFRVQTYRKHIPNLYQVGPGYDRYNSWSDMGPWNKWPKIIGSWRVMKNPTDRGYLTPFIKIVGENPPCMENRGCCNLGSLSLFIVATCTSKGVGLLQHQLQQIYPLERSCLGWPREALDEGTEHNLLVSMRVVSNDRLSKIDRICLCMFFFISDVPVPHAPCVEYIYLH